MGLCWWGAEGAKVGGVGVGADSFSEGLGGAEFGAQELVVDGGCGGSETAGGGLGSGAVADGGVELGGDCA